MPAKPMLDDVELQLVQKVEAEDEEVLAQHSVPALEGDFLQDLGRRVTRLTLVGVMTGTEAGEQLKTLRLKFRNAEPVTFVSDIATATTVDKVLIEEFAVRELAGKPERFEYEFTLREFLPPPPSVKEEPPPPPPEPELPDLQTGKLVVEVIVEGQPNFDFGKLTLTVKAAQEDGTIFSRTLANRADNVWTEEGLPPGEFTIMAVEINPQPILGTTKASVRPAQTAQAVLTAQVGSVIAKQIIIHFRSDRAFIEPCMRPVLRQAALHASNNSTEKLLIVGHTDKVDTPAYNQSLSERRARSVFAYLTVGRDRDAALAEWNLLRQTRPKGELPSIKDNWGVREYQFMLQDLGFYPGRVNGKEDDLTREAVSAFRCQKGLSSGTNVDDQVWQALIKDYLVRDALTIAETQLFPNARDACKGGVVKWVGCGESDPVKNVEVAFGPSRRVELLFVKTDQLPCDVSQPDTFDLPPATVTPTWCLDPKKTGSPCCFVVPVLAPADSKPKEGQWTRTPLEPGTISVEGSIVREDGKPLTLANRKLVLITPDGEIKAGEQAKGEPAPALANPDGTFKFPDKRIGVYSLEIQDDVLIRLDTQKASEAKGNAVCKSLTSTDTRLDIVILPEPALREIRLPVVAHLMTALHPTTRELRICVDTLTPGPQPQKTARTAQDVRELFDGANEIWRQARIRFDLVDIVEEVYADPAHPECAVGSDELATLLFSSAYPDTLDVFFVGTLESSGEAGVNQAVEVRDDTGNVISRAEGCALGDKIRVKIIVNADPILVQPGKEESISILGHELGHHLSLAPANRHVESTPANAGRLMLANVSATNRKLIKDEVQQARKAPTTIQQCQPLSLRVTGATQLGGSRSFDFMTFQNAAPVTIDALVDGSTTIDKGTVTMTGGQAGANAGQQTVGTASTGITDIVANYSATGGTVSVTRRVRVRVVTFSLFVTGARTNPDGKTALAKRELNKVATIKVQLSSEPFILPKNIVTWDKGQETPDPLRRTVSLGEIAKTTVTATIGTTTREMTILVVEVLVTSNKNPLGPAINQVQIEGILNKDLKDIDVGDLFATQVDSLFRLRAEIPGLAAGVTELTATIRSAAPGGGAINPPEPPIQIILKRTSPAGNRFLSLPLLAIPAAITRAEIKLKTPETVILVRARAGGKLTLDVSSPVPLGTLGVVEVAVRGRVMHVAAQAFAGSGFDLADIRRHISRANRAWAQAGVEIKERSAIASVPPPPNLLSLDQNVPFNGKLTNEEKLLLSIVKPGNPTRSPTATDINVYYVHDLKRALATTYESEHHSEVTDPTQSGIAVSLADVLSTLENDTTLSHELGHLILVKWGADEHKDKSGTEWPTANVMKTPASGAIELDRAQVENVLSHVDGGDNPFIIFEP